MKGVELVLPICTGTAAFWLGKKADDLNSHRWTVYVRSAAGEDVSHILSKVTFGLHHSFLQPSREVVQPPYEVSETGWGEFDISIQLQFAEDAHEESIELSHSLKLYSEAEPNPQSTRTPVVSEVYEEIVLNQPARAFYERIKSHIPRPAPASPLDEHFIKHSDAEEWAQLQAAEAKVDQMAQSLREKLAA
eukprot:CAMPEP_0119137022 /NCGR_PEP_ID=MMETSP1310-20130426/22702_1 /TAXON_ID=464262 /ORGANISM="Genus nov. species nov., Strain RCC2339" /LENGTH=190 /DNA_ID=CAMNT_0007128073 /DNA_START=1 /DNA_END=573 /DNA_ORIENTATION=+